MTELSIEIKAKRYDAIMAVLHQYIPFGDCPTAVLVREVNGVIDQLKTG